MDTVVYALCKKYVDDTLVGMGALKGAPAELEKVEDFDDDEGTGKELTIKWKDTNDVVHRKTFRIFNGVTPLMYMGSPQAEMSRLSNGSTFPVNPNKFNRPPKPNDLFFCYLIVTDNEKIFLYACAAIYDADNQQAIVSEHTKIATTGLKALTMLKTVEQNITSDTPFELPVDNFSRMPDGSAEECLIFDQYGHYRYCSISIKNDTTVIVTPMNDVVDINLGKVRYLHHQDIASDEWSVQFNLSFKYPDILVLDEDDNELYPEVEYYSDNFLYLRFSEPVKGIAYISK